MYMYIQVQLISSVFKQYLATCTTKRYLQSRIDDLHVNSNKLISPRYFFWTCHYWFPSEKIVVKCCHVFSDSHVFHKVIFGYLSFFPKWRHFFNLYLQYWMSRSFFWTLYIHLYHFSYATCRGLIVWFMVECFSEFFFHELLKFHCYNMISLLKEG